MSHIWSLPKHKPHEDYRSSRVTSPLWTASTALAERPEMISPACTWRRFVPPQRFGKPTTRFLEAQAARPLLHSLTTSWVDQGLPDHSNKGKPTIHPPQRWWPQASPPKKKWQKVSTKTAEWKVQTMNSTKIQHPARCFQQYQRISCWWYEKIHSVPPDRWASRRTGPTPIFHSWSALAHITWNLPGSHRRLASWIHSQSVPVNKPHQSSRHYSMFIDVLSTISSLAARIY